MRQSFLFDFLPEFVLLVTETLGSDRTKKNSIDKHGRADQGQTETERVSHSASY